MGEKRVLGERGRLIQGQREGSEARGSKLEYGHRSHLGERSLGGGYLR